MQTILEHFSYIGIDNGVNMNAIVAPTSRSGICPSHVGKLWACRRAPYISVPETYIAFIQEQWEGDFHNCPQPNVLPSSANVHLLRF